MRHQGKTLGARVKEGAKHSTGGLQGPAPELWSWWRRSSPGQRGRRHQHLRTSPHPVQAQSGGEAGQGSAKPSLPPSGLVTLIGLTPLLF